MAQLRLARAYAMHGNTAKARAADQGFLTLWKDADRDISKGSIRIPLHSLLFLL